MGSLMFDAGYAAGYRDAMAKVRRATAPRRGCGNKPKPGTKGSVCMHSVSRPGEIWMCMVCGETGGDDASGIEAATADKTTKIGLAEGESPAPERGDAQ